MLLPAMPRLEQPVPVCGLCCSARIRRIKQAASSCAVLGFTFNVLDDEWTSTDNKQDNWLLLGQLSLTKLHELQAQCDTM